VLETKRLCGTILFIKELIVRPSIYDSRERIFPEEDLEIVGTMKTIGEGVD